MPILGRVAFPRKNIHKYLRIVNYNGNPVKERFWVQCIKKEVARQKASHNSLIPYIKVSMLI